jgi:predicted Holliday junction resolvase-like endonuclease
LDIVFCSAIIVALLWFLYVKIFGGTKHQPTQTNTDLDRLIQREQQKEKEHESKINNLYEEINKLKNTESQLNINYNNLKLAYLELDKVNSKEIDSLNKKLEETTEAKKKVTSQKKSSEVRLGHIAETLAPFLDQFDFDPETCVFLGRPIDYISFGDDEITLIEVKSGKSQLNAKQRHIRDQVKAKLVTWKEVRIK